jgi:segregation and condensation protein A
MTGTHQDYRVQLDAYAGPLDLLLYLVKRHEIDLNDIPVAELTEQYLNHLKVIQEIDVELAGEFLVMAATLLEVKSQMLVPQVTEDGEEAPATDSIEDPTDPRYELVQQLLAYKRFKDAAIDLEERQREWEARLPPPPPPPPRPKKPHPPPPPPALPKKSPPPTKPRTPSRSRSTWKTRTSWTCARRSGVSSTRSGTSRRSR